MKRAISRAAIVLAASILMLVTVQIVLATVITVDGNGADWPGNKSPRTPGIQPCVPGPGCAWVVTDTQGDVNTPPGPQYDLSDFWATNDSNNVYFRTDTYSDVGTWQGTLLSSGFLNICLDSDNNPTTGITEPLGVCNKDFPMPGVDHILSFQGTTTLGNGRPTPLAFLDCNAGGPTCVMSATGTSDLRVAYNDAGVTEYSVPITDLNLFAGMTQPVTMAVGIYFDNGAPPSEDSIPNAPPYIHVTFGCAPSGTPCSPTAVTLESLSASTPQNETAMLILITAGVIALGVIGGLVVRRRRHTA